jgi:hypothetical protein
VSERRAVLARTWPPMDLKRALDVEEEVVDGDEEELAGCCPDAKRRRTSVK